MRERPHAATGYTYVEILLAVVIIAVLASLLLPHAIVNLGEDKVFANTKTMMAELESAYALYAQDNLPGTNTTPADFIANLNYLRIISDSSASIQVADATTQCHSNNTYGDCVSACDANAPCLLMHNKALLQYDPNATFNDGNALSDPPHNMHALRFLYDPDGSMEAQSATAIYLYIGGRTTTEQWSGITTYDTDLPKDAVAGSDGNTFVDDPEYLRQLSDG
ncbi:MAG: type II secretion system protein [Cyanobacteria bacterium HKST-UBA03]|nr:type II secretion system protein [Cyanobacteria bacterium HKST-UBA03]